MFETRLEKWACKIEEAGQEQIDQYYQVDRFHPFATFWFDAADLRVD
jgi:hypothetical protein